MSPVIHVLCLKVMGYVMGRDQWSKLTNCEMVTHSRLSCKTQGMNREELNTPTRQGLIDYLV